MKFIKRLSLALMILSLFSISYLVTSASAADVICSQASIDAGINGCATPGSAGAGHMNQVAPGSAADVTCSQASIDAGINGCGTPGSAAAGHMNQGYQGGAPGSAAAGPCAEFAPGTPPRQSCERQHGGR